MNGKCSCCGNNYDKLFEVTAASGETYTFDCIECAAQILAPRCAHCGCAILGHGVEAGDASFCCAHCAREEGAVEGRDRVPVGQAAADDYVGR